MNRFKRVITSSAVLAAIAALPVMSSYADELTEESTVTETSIVTTVPYETGEASEEPASSEEPAVTGEPSETTISEISDAEEEINKYFNDSSYDTDGNATLIKKEKVIYDSEEMQFIAVTTKDGSVFYVLINYSAAGEEDNVFFLNKVDDYDLYALLYSGSEDKVIDKDAAAEAADKATGNNEPVVNGTESAPESPEPEETNTVNSGISTSTIVIVLVIIAAAAAGGFLFFKSGKKKKETIDFDDTELDIDEE